MPQCIHNWWRLTKPPKVEKKRFNRIDQVSCSNRNLLGVKSSQQFHHASSAGRTGPQGTRKVSVHPGPISTNMAEEAGFGEIAEPPSIVVDDIFEALSNATFHVFPDTMAKQFWAAYPGYSTSVIESTAQQQTH